MPVVAPLAKVDKCKTFGANVIIEGAHIGEAKLYAEGLVDKDSLTYVNGYDDPPIIAGAGTIGMEVRNFEAALSSIPEAPQKA